MPQGEGAGVGTTGPLPPAGWYPNPSGTPGQAYWDGHSWGSLPPKRPVNRNQLLIGGAAAFVLLLVLLSNCGGDDKRSTSSMTSTVTTTVTARVPPSTVTVTVTQTPILDTPPSPAWTAPPSPVWTVPPPTTSAEQAPVLPLPLVPQAPASVYYPNCAAARAAGAAPIYVGEPGYRSGLDRDGDGVACE